MRFTCKAMLIAVAMSICCSAISSPAGAQRPADRSRLAQLTTSMLSLGLAQTTAEDLVDHYFLQRKLAPSTSPDGIDRFSAELIRWWTAERQLEPTAAADALLRVARARHGAAAAGFERQLQIVFDASDSGTSLPNGYNPPSFVPTGARTITRYLQFGHPRLGPIEKNGITRFSNGAIVGAGMGATILDPRFR